MITNEYEYEDEYDIRMMKTVCNEKMRLADDDMKAQYLRHVGRKRETIDY